MTKLPYIEVGFQLYTSDGEDPFGAVREVGYGGRPSLLVNIEGGGDFTIPLEAVSAVHSGKVVVKLDALTPEVQRAIRHAHDREEF
jgi:hypothetical protein